MIANDFSHIEANAANEIYLYHTVMGLSPGALQILVGGLSDDGNSIGAIVAMIAGIWRYLNAPTVGIIPEEYDYRPQQSNYQPDLRTRSDVWDLIPTERGKVIDKIFGNNLGETFPTIDIHDPVADEVTSIKSLDLSLKSYQQYSKLHGKLRGYIRELGTFVKGTQGLTSVTPTPSTVRIFLIVYPYGSILTQAQIEAMNSAKAYAASFGIIYREAWY